MTISLPSRIVLDNGLRVILAPNLNSYATTVAVIVTTGSDYEKKEESGISHFLEHMCFKGTERRPKPLDIAIEFDGMGAEYNAFTSREYTSYYAKVKADSWKKALDIVSDVYLNSIFNEAEIEKEKGVVIEEMHMYDDQPAERVSDAFFSLVYSDQAAGFKILGQEETVRSFTRDAVLGYHKQHYLSGSTVVLVSGNFDAAEAQYEIKSRFGSLPSSLKQLPQPFHEVTSGPKEVLLTKDSDQSHFVLGFPTFSISDSRRFALAVLSNVLGGGMSSRLFQRVREEMGAAYYISTHPQFSANRGLFLLQAGVQHAKLGDAIDASFSEIFNMKNQILSEAELRKAKDHMIGSIFLSLESSEEILYYYGKQEVFNQQLRNPEWLADSIEAVEAQDVVRVACDVFKPSLAHLAVIGPFKDRNFLLDLK